MLSTFIRIRSWQWTLIGLLVGGLGAMSVGMWGEPMLSSLGESINGKRDFEEALTRVVDGSPCFTNLTVYAQEVSDGGTGAKRTVYVVSGMYNDRSLGGKPAGWVPAFYVAEVPYHPHTDIVNLPGGGDAAKRFASQPRPTVVDFLDVLAAAKGVSFTNAWWRSPANARIVWLLVGVVGIGAIWPVTLNLVVFGSIRRPRERRISLRNVSTDAPAAAKVKQDPARTDELEGVIDEMLEAAEADAAPVPTPDRAPAPAPIRTLETRPLEAVAAATAADERAFGASAEDYYPTEIKTAKGKPGGPRSS